VLDLVLENGWLVDGMSHVLVNPAHLWGLKKAK
jgi:hypothetical protein